MTKGLLIVAVAAAMAAAPGCVPPQPESPYNAQHFIEPTTGRAYTMYVPSYYSSDQACPLVVALHGTYGFDSPDWEVTSWKDVAENHGLIVVAPELKSVQGILPVNKSLWLSDLDSDEKAILAVIDDVCSKYNIASVEEKLPTQPKALASTQPKASKPPKTSGSHPASKPSAPTVSRKAILLSGFSAGGYPMWYTGLRNPERFHMIIAMGANSSPDIFDRVDVMPELQYLHIAIVFGRDDVRKVQDESWAALQWLRSGEVRCFQTQRQEVPAGHLRRTELQYSLWAAHLPHPPRQPHQKKK